MDPNATMRDLVDSIQCGDHEAALASISFLLEWLGKGGFAPTLTPAQTITMLVEVQTKLIRDHD